jgi:hypothetical protein
MESQTQRAREIRQGRPSHLTEPSNVTAREEQNFLKSYACVFRQWLERGKLPDAWFKVSFAGYKTWNLYHVHTV